MKSKSVFVVIIGVFLSLLVFLVIYFKPVLPSVINSNLPLTNTGFVDGLKNKVQLLEEKVNRLSQQQTDLNKTLEDFNKYISSHSAQTTPTVMPLIGKSIFDLASIRGSLFTTSSFNYTPMGMYVNIKCPKNCYLWINFYSSAKNLGEPASAQGNINTFGLFLDNADQSIYSQASYPAASASVPVSLNTVVPAVAGVHTVEVRSKTSGGTLQSDSSALQVFAIER